MHSPSWSPEGWTCSHHRESFEAWAASQTLELQTEKGDITQQWKGNEHPKNQAHWTLHHGWHLNVSTPYPPTLDWGASLGSDHTGIHTHWLLTPKPILTHLCPLHTYKLDLDEEEQQKWKNLLGVW